MVISAVVSNTASTTPPLMLTGLCHHFICVLNLNAYQWNDLSRYCGELVWKMTTFFDDVVHADDW